MSWLLQKSVIFILGKWRFDLKQSVISVIMDLYTSKEMVFGVDLENLVLDSKRHIDTLAQ
ncbi:hypothetical protein TorRG33x02_140360 [Trema orientale]|uniref:Uncharacterized protein n=1 Tax=Trema orientale TaxID=63057 RepID=A0A2P5EXC2_TREOI|nr:hypothetical protein TorRG33x02_140360 [Trema orientale]